MTVTVLLNASPELLTRVDAIVDVLKNLNGVEQVRSIKFRPEDGVPSVKVPLPKADKKEVKEESKAVGVCTSTRSEPTREKPAEHPTYTVEIIRAKAKAAADEKGKPFVRECLDAIGATSVTTIPAEKYEEFMNRLTA